MQANERVGLVKQVVDQFDARKPDCDWGLRKASSLNRATRAFSKGGREAAANSCQYDGLVCVLVDNETDSFEFICLIVDRQSVEWSMALMQSAVRESSELTTQASNHSSRPGRRREFSFRSNDLYGLSTSKDL